MAVVRPTPDDFGIEHNEVVWRGAKPPRDEGPTGHSDWTGYSFGEPSAVCLPDGILLVVLWCDEPECRGIRYVRLRLSDAESTMSSRGDTDD